MTLKVSIATKNV